MLVFTVLRGQSRLCLSLRLSLSLSLSLSGSLSVNKRIHVFLYALTLYRVGSSTECVLYIRTNGSKVLTPPFPNVVYVKPGAPPGHLASLNEKPPLSQHG
jgi:hypothetical protein